MKWDLKFVQKLFSKYNDSVFNRGAAVRLPEAYRKFYKEWRETTPAPVHYIPDKRRWKKLETGEIVRVHNTPLRAFMKKELNNIITGGEMIILGFTQKHVYAPRNPHFWMPRARRSVIYSEILNKHIAVLITQRAIKLILDHDGFDSYILKNRACDLGSFLSVRFKRRLLLALQSKNLPYDEEKNNMILEKYKEYMLPPEELEWYGLTLFEAIQKLEEIEDKEKLEQIVPLKHMYRQSYIATLKQKEGKIGNSSETVRQ